LARIDHSGAVDAWIEEFKPIKNHLDSNSAWDGIMFETYGAEVEFVRKQKPEYIWTWWDVENGSALSAGYHYVNRIGYFITEKPWTDECHFVDVEEFEDNDKSDDDDE
jgi:hypothetical protein